MGYIKNSFISQVTNMGKMNELLISDRPREKLLDKGSKSLSDIELLSILLGKGTQKKDVLCLSNEIMKVHDNNLRNMDVNSLLEIVGIGPAKACNIIAGFELARRYNGRKISTINCPEDIIPWVSHVRDKKQEYFIGITLNGANEVISNRVVTVGLLDSNQIHPREVFADAISDRAASVVLVHNHPSGNLEPSEEDKQITRQMREAGKILGIKVLDHLIITKDEYYSINNKFLS